MLNALKKMRNTKNKWVKITKKILIKWLNKKFISEIKATKLENIS
jgi:hypothetical protein